MKKCASCSKDLPDAALHCVFCGAKQAPAPTSSTAANAKTVMGNYSASDMIAALKAGGTLPSAAAITPPPAAPVVGTPPVQPPRNASGPTPAPYAPPQAVQSPYAPAPVRPAPPATPPMIRPPAPPAVSTPSSGPPSMPPPLAHGVPVADSAAKTVMAQAPVIPQSPAVAAAIAQGPTGQGAGPSAWQPPAASAPAPAAVTAPSTPSTPDPEPVAPPYLASQTAARAGRPVEPWNQTLRMVMFIFGVLAIAYMAIPKSIDPLQFALFGIIENEGTAKIEPILVGAIGVLGLLFSFIPMPTMPRGLLAGVLGLAYAIVPTILKGLDTDIPWQALAIPGAMIFLIPGLVLRSEYKDSLLPRILVTLGALGLLATLLVPVNDNLPLIGLVEAVIDGDLEHKIAALLGLLVAVMAVLSLLVWLPAPSGGGAKVFAWFFILFPLFEHIYKVLYTEDVVNLITATPAQIFVGWAPAAAAFAFLGYGMATVLGKSLE